MPRLRGLPSTRRRWRRPRRGLRLPIKSVTKQAACENPTLRRQHAGAFARARFRTEPEIMGENVVEQPGPCAGRADTRLQATRLRGTRVQGTRPAFIGLVAIAGRSLTNIAHPNRAAERREAGGVISGGEINPERTGLSVTGLALLEPVRQPKSVASSLPPPPPSGSSAPVLRR
jgi:hypothetical protein